MNGKRFAAVICEYNPFHFGHKYQMEALKAEFDGVICVLSGDMVQRGSLAVADKYLRAEAALKSGADLVLELPIPWCCSSARDFAAAGVHIADGVGADHLAFGAEDSLELLSEIQKFTLSNEFSNAFKRLSEDSKNISYPQALTEIIAQRFGNTAAEALKKPNNILALEYLKALEGKNMSAHVIKRKGEFSSSSEIRAAGEGEKMLELLPEESKDVFGREINKLFPRDSKKLDTFYIGKLRQILSDGEPTDGYYSAPVDLAKKILFAALKHSTADAVIFACSDKNYTHARVRRAINALVFGITPERVHKMPPYTTVLAANGTGREILKNAKKNKKTDIITKPAHALLLGNEAKEAYLFSKGIEDILLLAEPFPTPADAAKNPIIGE